MQRNLFKFIVLFSLMGNAQIAKADEFRILSKEREALQCRIDLIARAQKEILISTYIIREDEVGLGLRHL